MKRIQVIIAVLLSVLFFGTVQAQDKLKREKIQVSGNCGMCKKTIEAAAKSAGASVAIWNEDKELLVVGYDPSKTTRDKIEEAIAAKGYDTKNKKGSDAAYNKLPECCKYERKGMADVEN